MKKIWICCLSCIFILVSCFSQAQQNKIDSLLRLLKNTKTDTAIVNTLNDICGLYIDFGDYELTLQYAKKAQELAEKLNYKKGIADVYNNIGSAYNIQGNYSEALINFLKALKLAEEIGYKKASLNSYNNIGNLYRYKNNYGKALEFYFKALKINTELGDRMLEATNLSNIGIIFGLQGDKKKALEHYFKSLKIRIEIGDNRGVAACYNNIGLNYMNQGKDKLALENFLKALEITNQFGFKQVQAITQDNIGIIYLRLNQVKEANCFLNQSLIISKEIGYKNGIEEAYSSLAELFEKKGDYQQAYKYHKLYSNIKDTLLNEQSSKQIAEMNTKYDSEKKDKELIQKTAEISKQHAETEKQNIKLNAFIIGFILVLILAFFIFRSYRQKQNANKLLEEKNILIENQKQLVEEKNLKITDSINYAKRIQQAILPSQEIIKSSFPESFVFFNPKNIVSGDFYWMHAIDKYNILLAAVDCTGHGVPGALMSMMGYNLLEQVVKGHNTVEPAMILNELSRLVIESLRQTEGLDVVKDGMDISICRINFQNYELEYAGAHNSLYLIRNGMLTETKADQRSVGISAKSLSFSNHKIKLEKGDCFYIFSDGYVDQKGGPDNTKIFYQPFRDLLTQLHQLPMEMQREKLEKVMLEWKDEKEQIDDMLIIGVRI